MNDNRHSVFICELPPPFGGVTVKNKLFYGLISRDYKVKIIDLMECKRSIWKSPFILFNCIKEWLFAENVIYGIGTSDRLKLLLKIQKFFNKSFFNTSVIAMGGVFDKSVLNDPFLKNKCKNLKGIWVETIGMKNNLEINNFNNIHIFPNPKSSVGSCQPNNSDSSKMLRVLYFSQISREKGVEDIFTTIELINNSFNRKNDFIFDFYGHIVDDFKTDFKNYIEKYNNVTYQGIFDSTTNSLYQKLNEYDVLLFPTHWDTEGVPGILVESKMAGLAIIASQKSFNNEIVREEFNEGIIIKKDYAFEMANALIKMKDNSDWLRILKYNSFKSRERYELEKFDNICDVILSNNQIKRINRDGR